MSKKPTIEPFKSALKGDLKFIQKNIPGKYDSNAVDPETKKTVLHYAAESGKAELVEYLTFQGANMNMKDSNGNTPLHVSLKIARTNESYEAVALYLIKRGADLDIESKELKTPLRLCEDMSNRFKIKLKEATAARPKGPIDNSPPVIPLPPIVESTPAPAPSSIPSTSAPAPKPSTVTPASFADIALTNMNPSRSTHSPMLHATSVESTELPSLDDLLDSFDGGAARAKREKEEQEVALRKQLEGEEYERNKQRKMEEKLADLRRDLPKIWIDALHSISALVLHGEISATPKVQNMIKITEELLDDLRNEEVKKTVKIDNPSMKLQVEEAIAVIPERMALIRDCVRRLNFSQIKTAENFTGVLGLVGSMYYLYMITHRVTKDDITASIAGVAMACKASIESINTSAQNSLPRGVLTNAAALTLSISNKVFEIKAPGEALKMSDSAFIITRSFKSMVLFPMFAASGKSTEVLSSVTKGIAEALQIIRGVSNTIMPASKGPSVTPAEEENIYVGAQKALKISVDFYLANRQKVPLPFPSKLVPLLNTIQDAIPELRNATYDDKSSTTISICKKISSTVSIIRDLFLARKGDFEEDEVGWKNLGIVLEGSMHFAIQLMIAANCYACQNSICP
eukprot:TRINITY_DN4120_c0_g1_i3.p1 TRINITY_DN4120_c0_g1~~TRINITY_DN4120_c0_g1_i3.p1  ORF type:complete len:630 (-),score=186.77 TRINITY_DN4120_c0_g1_i3:79-1968(-)